MVAVRKVGSFATQRPFSLARILTLNITTQLAFSAGMHQS